MNVEFDREFWEEFVPKDYELHAFTGTTSVTFRHRLDRNRLVQLRGPELALFIQLSLEIESAQAQLREEHLRKAWNAGWDNGVRDTMDPWGENALTFDQWYTNWVVANTVQSDA